MHRYVLNGKGLGLGETIWRRFNLLHSLTLNVGCAVSGLKLHIRLDHESFGASLYSSYIFHECTSSLFKIITLVLVPVFMTWVGIHSSWAIYLAAVQFVHRVAVFRYVRLSSLTFGRTELEVIEFFILGISLA
jgi:hypothetical protein